MIWLGSLRGAALWGGAALLGLAGAPIQAWAQSPEPTAQEMRRDEALIMLDNQVKRAAHVQEIRRALLNEFHKRDLDGGGVGPSDARLLEEQAAARGRMRQIRDWLRHDLDGDGQVSEAELRRALRPLARQPLRSAAGELDATEAQVDETLDRLVSQAAAFDRNGDGVATFDEALATIRARAEQRFDPSLNQTGGVSEIYDLDGDGVIRQDEFAATFDLLLAEFNQDGDELLSDGERAALREAAREAARRKTQRRAALRQANRLRRQGRDCGFPELADDARLVLLELGEGAAVPTAALRSGMPTSLADLVIEPGDAPLYVVAISEQAMILRVSGAVDRLASLVLVKPSLAVAGPGKDHAAWLEPSRCFALIGRRADWSENDGAAERLALLALGRPPEETLRPPRPGRVLVPSGAPAEDQSFPGALALSVDHPEAGALWRGFLDRFPGGLVEIDPEMTAAPAPLVPAAPPPGRAGLARLVEEGALRLVSEAGWGLDALPTRGDGALELGAEGFFDKGSTRAVLEYAGGKYRRDPEGAWRRWRPPVFEVLKSFKAPAGLVDRDQAIFRVAAGGPKPRGALGESILEEIPAPGAAAEN